MAGHSIPNLLSLRGPRGGLHGRGRRGPRHPGSSSSGPNQDEIVQGTDTDAAVSRLSAVSLGYLADPFAQSFVTSTPGPTTRRLPIINRGTYTRTTAIDRLVESFLSGPSLEKQIISLGAGTDTRSLRLLSSASTSSGLVYCELDFPAISRRKRQIAQISPVVRNVLKTPMPTSSTSSTSSSSPTGEGYDEIDSWTCALEGNSIFSFTGIDLRHLPSKQSDIISGLRTDIPTILISECCLCYLEVSEAKDVIRWFTDRIPNVAIVLYEPVKPHDAFGEIMVSNLAARGIRMPTLQEYREVGDQKSRLSEAGFERVAAMTMEDIWDGWVSEDEKERVDGLEGLDEVEEWALLAGHYVVAWGSRGEGFASWDRIG